MFLKTLKLVSFVTAILCSVNTLLAADGGYSGGGGDTMIQILRLQSMVNQRLVLDEYLIEITYHIYCARLSDLKPQRLRSNIG